MFFCNPDSDDDPRMMIRSLQNDMRGHHVSGPVLQVLPYISDSSSVQRQD